jgi:hypothetical protein
MVLGFINGSSSKIEESKKVNAIYQEKIREHKTSLDSLKQNINKLEQIKQLYKK